MVKYLNQCSSGYINIVSFHFLFMKVFWNRPKAFSLFVDKFFWGSRDRNKYYFQCAKYVKTCRNRKHSMPAKRSTGAIYRFQPSSELFEKVDEPKQVFLIFIIILSFLSGCSEQFYSTNTGPTSCLQDPPCHFRGPFPSRMGLKFSFN